MPNETHNRVTEENEEAMAVVDVINIRGEKVSEMDLPDALFNVRVKKSVLHQVVTSQLAGRRTGNASVKHRSEVSGSTRKLFRQKGTGRARRGDIKSPLLRGGGVVFGPDGRNYTKKVPKRVRRLALKMALSSKLQEKQLLVVDQMTLEQVKTKELASVLTTLNLENALIVTEAENPNLELSIRNIPRVRVIRSEGLNVYDVLKHRHLVLLAPAVKQIEGRLQS